MKRVTWLLIVSAMVVGACSGDGDSATTTAAETTVTTAVETTVTTAAGIATSTLAPFGLEPGTVTAGVLLVDGVVREYLVAVPPGYSRDMPAPVIFDLHGRGGTAAGQAITSQITIPAWDRGFVVVHPQAVGNAAGWPVWPDSPERESEVAFFQMMIDHLADDLAIDRDRVFVTGFCNGGGMAGRLACEMADQIAGIAPVAASNEGWTECEPSESVPVFAFHGLADQEVIFDGGQALLPSLPDWAGWWADANGCETNALPTEMPTGLHWHWAVCDGESTVSLVALYGIGHEWPTKVQEVPDADGPGWSGATEIIVDFFAGL
jgi:polyhydroxybutyrate depolymerase